MLNCFCSTYAELERGNDAAVGPSTTWLFFRWPWAQTDSEQEGNDKYWVLHTRTLKSNKSANKIRLDIRYLEIRARTVDHFGSAKVSLFLRGVQRFDQLCHILQRSLGCVQRERNHGVQDQKLGSRQLNRHEALRSKPIEISQKTQVLRTEKISYVQLSERGWSPVFKFYSPQYLEATWK